MLTRCMAESSASDVDSRGNLRGFIEDDEDEDDGKVIPDSQDQSVVTISDDEDDRPPVTPPPCHQPTPSLDTVFHQVEEESRRKRKAETEHGGRAPLKWKDDGSPLSSLVEVCERERKMRDARDTPSSKGCDFCAFQGFVPSVQGMLDDLKDNVVRTETGLAIAAELLKKCHKGCVCPPSGGGENNNHGAKQRALGSPFNPRKEAVASRHSRRVMEDIDDSVSTSDSDDEPLRRTTRARRR